jgi:DNA-binding transcriptional LysR family regulator
MGPRSRIAPAASVCAARGHRQPERNCPSPGRCAVDDVRGRGFSRGGHGIALTAAGETLLPYARKVLESLEDAHVAVAAVDHDVRTRVEVIANESVSTYLLPAALSEVRKQWPKLRFAVTVGMCPSITEGLSTARYDVGLMLQNWGPSAH